VFSANWSQAWNGIVSIFKGIFNLIPTAIETIINGAIGLINGLTGGINVITGVVGIPEIPKIPTVTLPRLAKGTKNWQGGLVQISERGGEIVDLPQGSRVYPHDKSVDMARKQGQKDAGNHRGTTTVTINIPKFADQFVVREDSDIDKIAQAIGDKLEKVAKNMGGGEIEYSY
jgi:phage-related protein